MIKGYIIRETGRAILEDEVLARTVPAEIISRIRANATLVKPSEWYPRKQATDLWDAIAAASASGGEEHARAALVRCGELTCAYAVGSFMKLLLKVLSPQMFAKKFPDLWARDHNTGRIEVAEVADTSMHLIVRDVEAFNHIAPISQGYGAYTLRAMGLQGLEILCSPWSIAQPNNPEFHFKAKWGA